MFYFFSVIPPPIMWAQRTNCLFLTVCLEDCKEPEIRLEPGLVFFKGIGGTEKKHHELTIPLYKEIDPEVSVSNSQLLPVLSYTLIVQF